MYDYPSLHETPTKPLEPRQQRFCEEYLKDMNATAAAKRAGYSIKNAHNTGSKILALPLAKAYIRKAMDNMADVQTMRTRLMNQELLDLMHANMGEFFDDNGDIKNLSEIPEHLRKAVEVKTTKVKGKRGVRITTTYNLLNRVQMMEKIIQCLSATAGGNR